MKLKWRLSNCNTGSIKINIIQSWNIQILNRTKEVQNFVIPPLIMHDYDISIPQVSVQYLNTMILE